MPRESPPHIHGTVAYGCVFFFGPPKRPKGGPRNKTTPYGSLKSGPERCPSKGPSGPGPMAPRPSGAPGNRFGHRKNPQAKGSKNPNALKPRNQMLSLFLLVSFGSFPQAHSWMQKEKRFTEVTPRPETAAPSARWASGSWCPAKLVAAQPVYQYHPVESKRGLRTSRFGKVERITNGCGSKPRTPSEHPNHH